MDRCISFSEPTSEIRRHAQDGIDLRRLHHLDGTVDALDRDRTQVSRTLQARDGLPKDRAGNTVQSDNDYLLKNDAQLKDWWDRSLTTA
ncbi:hypothetical protein [Bosea sp. (in: a-proteobacteria)]|uniref:hypothetical protein n=1 Tax=Bosea sp. (in: a-proteobacteria) TaxID=1871050 RepID=UPI0025BC9A97|nr:hypothetical protein [Bosea sp. (in: a-proteobacteria)]